MIGETFPKGRWRRDFGRLASPLWRSWVSCGNWGEAGGVLAFEQARPKESARRGWSQVNRKPGSGGCPLQESDLRAYAERSGFAVVAVFRETLSGIRKGKGKRPVEHGRMMIAQARHDAPNRIDCPLTPVYPPRHDIAAPDPRGEPQHAPGPHDRTDQSANGIAARGRQAETTRQSTAPATYALTECTFSYKPGGLCETTIEDAHGGGEKRQ
jgi:hypothetical protein